MVGMVWEISCDALCILVPLGCIKKKKAIREKYYFDNLSITYLFLTMFEAVLHFTCFRLQFLMSG